MAYYVAARSSRTLVYSVFLAALFVTAWNLVARRRTDDIYLYNWYTIGGVLWTCIIAAVAILP